MLKSRHIHDTSIGFSVQDILSFSENFDFVSWSFVKKGGNTVAHHLAHRQSLGLKGSLWESVVPEDILSWPLGDMYAYVNNNLM